MAKLPVCTAQCDPTKMVRAIPTGFSTFSRELDVDSKWLNFKFISLFTFSTAFRSVENPVVYVSHGKRGPIEAQLLG